MMGAARHKTESGARSSPMDSSKTGNGVGIQKQQATGERDERIQRRRNEKRQWGEGVIKEEGDVRVSAYAFCRPN